MLKVRMLMGLPASGKTTYARELVAQGGWTRINFDDLRSMMHNGKWTRGNEKIVQAVARELVREALDVGHNVVWDNTSFAPKHEAFLRDITEKEYDADFEIEYFHVEPEEAIKRDLARPNSVGPQVIWDMYYRYVWDAPDTPENNNMPDAVILDVDGTLAHNDGHRGWYQWDKVGGDAPVNHVCELARMYEKAGYAVLVVTGRDGSCINITDQWLKDHNVPFHDLFSRAEGDMRPDTVVKKEIYDEHIRDHYNVHLVIDDRESVVRMWSDVLGLRVLQARTPGNYPDF